LCGLWYPYSGRGHKNLTLCFITVIMKWVLHVEWVCYEVHCACQAIQCCKLIVVIVNILLMSCLWFICTIFCSCVTEWTPMSELNHCQNLQNRFLQVLCFDLPFIAKTFQGRAFDGGLSCGIASLISIVRQKISIFLRIQAFRDLTLFLGGGGVFPGTGLLGSAFLRSAGNYLHCDIESHPRKPECVAASAL